MKKYWFWIFLFALGTLIGADQAMAEEAGGAVGGGGLVAIGAGLCMAVAAFGGTFGQGRVVSMGLESIGRNPSASGKMFVPMILGLVFLETLVIFSFVIALQLAGKA
jgi:F-type H+-transporting ATPase subunit c